MPENSKLAEDLDITIKLCEYIKNGDSKILGEESDTVWFRLEPVRDIKKELNAFTGAWAPIEYGGKVTDTNWIIGLAYIEEDNVFGEFEGEAGWWEKRKDRWLEIRYYDYDPRTKTLTIDFDKNQINATGTATYQLIDSNTLVMTNQGGSWTFTRLPMN